MLKNKQHRHVFAGLTRNPLKISRTGLIIGCVLLLTACNGRPGHVLSESKMEDILFDLHLAENAISDNFAIFAGDSVRKQQLLNSVFDKHKVTEQKFDTSLIWYNAHLDKFLKINEHISQRYATILSGLQAEKEKMEPKKVVKVVKIPNYVELQVPDTLQLFPIPTVLHEQELPLDTTVFTIPLRMDSLLKKIKL
ncbi:hypothetical protein AGMMS49525_06120 [Bacteroidia bacterium]|nr:hypothetical protein AGMMS49525_06120 [Bacteroidia bacterium]